MTDQIIQSIVIVTLFILVLLGIIMFTFFISSRRRYKQEMAMTETKLAFEKELRLVETEVSENIRNQFGQELHDNIGQLLTAMHIQIENQKLDHPQLSDGLKPVSIYLDEVTQQLRLLSRTNNNDYLGHIGLFAAIQVEVDRLRTLRRFQVTWEPVSGSTNLGKNQELMVFRILQEIIQNALRHSGAKMLQISVDNSDEGFILKVQDDGRGFDPKGMLQGHKASGLRNIIKRARIAGLECDIQSESGKGSLYVLKKIATLD
jgi:two-component system NarL family sensor kinase